MNQQPLLITGATGFFARHLLAALERELPGALPLALVRDPAAWTTLDWTAALPGVETVQGAVTDTVWTRDKRLQGLGGIFHLAALVRHTRRDPQPVYDTNIEGTLNMVRLAATHGCRMVLVSTSGTVGCFRSADQTADETAPYCTDEVDRWPYYHSKIRAERAARALAAELGVELVIVRPPVLLGPGDHRFRSTSHIIKYLRRKLPFLIQGGIHFVDVRDAASALLAAMTRPAVRPLYHLPGTACSIVEFFGLVRAASGVPGPRWFLPYRPAWLLATLTRPLGLLPDPVVVEMASRHWGLTSLHAREELGFDPRPGAETVADTVAWLQQHHPALAPEQAPVPVV